MRQEVVTNDFSQKPCLKMLEPYHQRYADTWGDGPTRLPPFGLARVRTYDPLREVPTPEGSHVPMVLANMSRTDPKAWERLRSSLVNFGNASGLFTDIEVKRKGQKESDPFQIEIKSSSRAFNLVDVGYGVSQVLPIVVDVLQEPKDTTFLLQQPEVHLHPKAQAELGSFLAILGKEQHKRFVIETHSDYLIDRIRMDVRDRKGLRPSDVAILYFEKIKGEVQIHHLEIDSEGNIVNTPPNYREFFLQEERRLFFGA